MVSMTARNFRRIDDGRRRKTTHGGAGLGPQVSTTRNERPNTGFRRNSVSSTMLSIAEASSWPVAIMRNVLW